MTYIFRLHSILTSARPTRDLHHSSSYVLVNKNEQKKRPNFVTPRLLKTHQRQFTSLTSRKKLLLAPIGTRGLGWVPTVIRGVLKIRYLLLGGAIGILMFPMHSLSFEARKLKLCMCYRRRSITSQTIRGMEEKSAGYRLD